MTKAVRIENACTSDYKVVVEVWERDWDGVGEDKLIDTIKLDYPTAMTGSNVYITSTRYLIVKEA